MLELGAHLVNELGLADSTDTLGRWLAHHLAELMHDIDSEGDPAARKQKLAVATDVIQRLWAGREHLPGKANPVTPYKDVIRVLDRLVPPANPWHGLHATELQRTAATLFDRLSRLTVGLLLLELDLTKIRGTKRSSAEKHLTTDERRILEHLRELLVSLGIRTDVSPADAASTTPTLSELMIEIADEITQELLKVRENIRKWENVPLAQNTLRRKK